MATVATPLQVATPNSYTPPGISEQISIALLGFGQVGAAVAGLAARAAEPAVAVAGALVRDTVRRRDRCASDGIPLTTDAEMLLDSRPDAIVEVLGGLEPARTLVLDALGRGIPVVTANKSLVAIHGDELLNAAADAHVPLRYEATVVAGVPFLGTFVRRPFASAINSIVGVVNGTTNFILSRMTSERATYAAALQEAQALGLAEPDPAKDVRGIDAAEKLCILLRHFGRWSTRPRDLETTGIDEITAADLEQAHAAGGTIKPVVFARWDGTSVAAFAGPAFLPARHPLAGVHGLTNGIVLGGGPAGDLFYCGPGAGPAATAVTILDDVAEVVDEARAASPRAGRLPSTPSRPRAPETGWFLRASATALPHAADVADLLASFGVWLQRTSETATHDGLESRWSWTYPCAASSLTAALRALSAASGCRTLCIRRLEAEA